MRTLFIILLGAICISMASCSSEKESFNSVENKSEVYTKLEKELSQYNVEFWQGNETVVQTRGFWKRLTGFIIADASGALFGFRFGGWGALFCSILNSAIAGPVFAAEEYQEITPIKPIEPIDTTFIPLSDVIGTPQDPIETEYSDIRAYTVVTTSGTGYLHNMILSDINEKHPDIYSKGIESNIMAEYIAEEMESTYQYIIPQDEKETLIQTIDSLIPQEDSHYNGDILAYLTSFAPEYSNELSIINDFATNVESLSEQTEEIKNYLDGYLEIIESSDLTDEEKVILKTCIEVAANSAALWIVK